MNHRTLSRRSFLHKTALAGSAAGVTSQLQVLGKPDKVAGKRPNVIFITTDQQSSHMMSCAGNKWLKTPAMDYIARNGIRFDRAYTSNPVCSPARVSWMTGRLPEYFAKPGTRIRENGASMGIKDVPPEVQRTHIAAYLKKAGYALAYAGKSHLPKPLTAQAMGFKVLSKDQRDNCAEACATFIRQKHEDPYYLWINLINPHDICYYAINDYRFDPDAGGKRQGRGGTANQKLLKAMQLPEGVSEQEFFAKHCPPLPANHEPQANEPASITQLAAKRAFKKRAREEYNEKDWRLHRWAYHRLTEVVDRQVQVILDGLRDSGQEENTVVILTSDHGDHSASHKLEHKSTFYEEVASIPFLVMHRGTAPAGRVDTAHLVSNGIDLLPTVCDYAGIPDAKADPRGRSLRPLIEGRKVDDWRRTLGVEAEVGRMVVNSSGLKYIRYDLHGDQEQLLDMSKDPGETKHFTEDPQYAEALTKLRKDFDENWFPKS